MTGQQMLSPVSDAAGLETLEIFAGTDKFNAWLFETLTRDCKSNILEIGSGIGNISSLLLQKFSQVTLSDLRSEYCERLLEKFHGNGHLKSVEQIDLSEIEFEKKYPRLQESYDSVIASNVIEHIEDDHLAIRNCGKMLKKNGRLAVLVPAYQALYNGFDKELGHYRRYNKKLLTQVFLDEGFEVVHRQYFNFAGIFGWWFSGTVLNKKILPKNQLVLYNKLTPLIKLADRVVMSRAGLSVIVVGEKK